MQLMGLFRRNQREAIFGPGTYRGAVLTRIPPVPVLSKVPLGTGLALGGRVSGAVSHHGRARRTLVAQEEFGRHRVAVLVLGQNFLLLEGPGERSCEELKGREEGGGHSTQLTVVTKSSDETHLVHSSSLDREFSYLWRTRRLKASSERELRESSELNVEVPGGDAALKWFPVLYRPGRNSAIVLWSIAAQDWPLNSDDCTSLNL